MSGKHRKGGNPNPHPGNTEAHNQKRSISGDVHVRGEIVVESSPKESAARNAEESKEDSRHRKNWWLNFATLIVDFFFDSLKTVKFKLDSPTATILFPEVPSDPASFERLTAKSLSAVTAPELDWINAHDQSIYVVGRIYYKDMAGNDYTSDICLVRAAGKVANCGSHNDIR
jgi:hypothetical protein